MIIIKSTICYFCSILLVIILINNSELFSKPRIKITNLNSQNEIQRIYLQLDILDSNGVYQKINSDFFIWDFKNFPKGMKFDKELNRIIWQENIKSGKYEITIFLKSPLFNDSLMYSFELLQLNINHDELKHNQFGVSLSNFTPFTSNIGSFNGFDVDYSFISFINLKEEHTNYVFKFSSNISMLTSNYHEIDNLYMLNFSFLFSLVPIIQYKHFAIFGGIDFDLISQKEIGTDFFYSPTIGLWNYYNSKVITQLKLNYLYFKNDKNNYNGIKLSAGISYPF